MYLKYFVTYWLYNIILRLIYKNKNKLFKKEFKTCLLTLFTVDDMEIIKHLYIFIIMSMVDDMVV